MENETKPNEEIKVDRLYDKDITFNEIMNNPILQPVSEANTIYKSQGLIIQRALFEYEKVKEQITILMKENPTYQQTMLIARFRDVLEYSGQIIHSQDIQREVIKRCLNDIIKIVGKNYESRVEAKNISFPQNLETGNMGGFIQDKIEKKSFGEEDIKKKKLDAPINKEEEEFEDEFVEEEKVEEKKEIGKKIEEDKEKVNLIAKPDGKKEIPKRKRGRPKKKLKDVQTN